MKENEKQTIKEIKKYLDKIAELDKDKTNELLSAMNITATKFRAKIVNIKTEAFKALEKDLEEVKNVYNNLKQRKEKNDK